MSYFSLKKRMKTVSNRLNNKRSRLRYYITDLKQKIATPTGLLSGLAAGFVVGYFFLGKKRLVKSFTKVKARSVARHTAPLLSRVLYLLQISSTVSKLIQQSRRSSAEKEEHLHKKDEKLTYHNSQTIH